MMSKSVFWAGEAETIDFGKRLAAKLESGAVLFLQGSLGAGKTTFTRGMLNALGHSGPVKSPTYTLVEPYELNGQKVYHFDLYRLADPEELEYLGIRDYFNSQSVSVVEWPSRGEGYLPTADISLTIEVEGQGRRVTIESDTAKGQKIIERLFS